MFCGQDERQLLIIARIVRLGIFIFIPGYATTIIAPKGPEV